MTSPVLLITAPLDTHQREQFQNFSPPFHVQFWQEQDQRVIPDTLWREVEVLYTSFATPLPHPDRVSGLRWVQLYSAGPDQILTHPLFSTPVIFTTTSGIHATPIAEYVLTMTLAWFHHFPRFLTWQKDGSWPAKSVRSTFFAGEEVRGKTFGIVGYGSIGRELARLATAFGMRVLATQRGTDHRDPGFVLPGIGDPAGTLPARYYSPGELHTMLAECDIVVIAAPLTVETRGMFDEAAFAAMKSTAFLVNIARGDICDEAALLRALEEKQIAGAALDVFHQEPLPTSHPLWSLPNVFISPHSAGLSSLYNERAATLFAENLRRYLANEPLFNVVDKLRAY